MTNCIELHTQLDSGIYKSQGGGQDLVVRTWTPGPRNLLKALAALHEERASNKLGYGNIGCGRSWLEIAGQVIPARDIESDIEIEREYTRYAGSYSHHAPTAATQIARKALAQYL
jgi:hypothetical protein